MFLTKTNDYQYLVSLDAHKRTYFAKIIDTSNEKILYNHGIIGTIDEVIEQMVKLKLPPKKTLVIYEAGCVGYHPYKKLVAASYSCSIIAPSSIPQNNKLKKTDKNDCRDNLNYFRSGLLRFVTVPDDSVLSLRELNRHRAALVDDLRKKKQQICAFVLRHGYFFDETKTEWTVKHVKWLRGLKMSNAALQSLHDMQLKEYDSIDASIGECEKTIKLTIEETPDLVQTLEKLKFLPGFGDITAQTIHSELGDLSRFKKPNQLPQYVGLAPGMHQSGKSSPSLSITKEGNEYARRMLISASRYYGDQRLLYSQKELDKFPKDVGTFLKKMQDRLHSRYIYLKRRGKNINKVRCAIARELVMFVWEFQNSIVSKLNIVAVKRVKEKKAA